METQTRLSRHIYIYIYRLQEKLCIQINADTSSKKKDVSTGLRPHAHSVPRSKSVLFFRMLRFCFPLYIYTKNCCVQVDILILNKSLQNSGSTYGQAKIQNFTTDWTTSRKILLTVDIHHLSLVQQTDTNISNLNSYLGNIFNKLITELSYKLATILTPNHIPLPVAQELTANTYRNVTVPRWPASQLRYKRNFEIPQLILNSY